MSIDHQNNKRKHFKFVAGNKSWDLMTSRSCIMLF